MIKPDFVYSNKYYYDIYNNRIYGKEKNSHNYHHEYRHFLINKISIFQKLNFLLSEFTQFILIMIPIYFLIFLNDSYMVELGKITFISMLFFIGVFVLGQEIDAEIYAIRKTYKNFKRLK